MEIAVDSGACDPVMPVDVCPHIQVKESEAKGKCLEYEVANGATIRNERERRCLLMTLAPATRSI